MFKIACLFAILAVAAVSAEPKPGVLAYNAPLVAAAPAAAYISEGGAVYERTFHGNTSPYVPLAAAAYAAPYAAPYAAAAPYVAAPLAYSAPYVSAAAAPAVLFK